MPFNKHPEFIPPDSPDAKIWRYMDLAKFLSLLNQRCLYFSRLDRLSAYDPFEGYYTHLNLAFDNLRFEDMSAEWKESSGIKDEKIFSAIIEGNKRSRELVKYHRSVTFVNSWHIKEHESAAMWKVYLSNNEGIAIQSTYQRLVESLASYNDLEVYVGKIKYIDYEKEAIPMDNLLFPFMYKRKSFEYEDELRALIWTPQHGKNDILNPQGNKFSNTLGLTVTVDVTRLIDNIFVAPNAPSWIFEVIRAVTNKFGIDKVVKQSNLTSTPVY
ncbi:MAG: hypothetical protein DID89_2727548040 [Candidatus Nitrotoga sp. CP45]|nr:MAG: hypothetical protein DID89_2727548040 [Candidatus Nitrotoga sp. CP45]